MTLSANRTITQALRPATGAGWVAPLAAAFLLLAFTFAALAAALAAAIPPLTGRIVDSANMMSPADRAALTQRLEAFEKKSSDQVVVATIDTLDGESIESFSNRLFRAWKLGQAQDNNGVLLLVVKNDRKMRIEVGYGLEGTLTDLHSSLIIQDMAQKFRAGDFSGGISLATDDIVKVLEGNAAELEARAKRNQKNDGGNENTIIILFFLLWFGLIVGSILMSILPRIYGQEIAPGRYRWLGMEFNYNRSRRASRGSGGWVSGSGGGWSSGGGGGWSSGGGGFSGGGGSSGGGGASGSW